MEQKIWKILSYLSWFGLLIFMILAFYVNHSLPRGEKYPTGEYVCQNDDRGPCAEEYREDLENLDIPE